MVEDINVLNIGGHAIGKTEYPSTMTPKRYDAFLQARDLSERAEIKDKHHDKEFIYRYVYYEPIDISQNAEQRVLDRKSTRLNSSHVAISYAVFCLKTNNP